MSKLKKMTLENGYLPKLTKKTHSTLLKFWRLEVLLAWNNTYLSYLKSAIFPCFSCTSARYGLDIEIGWLGGYIEISYIKKTFRSRTGISEKVSDDKCDSDSGVSLHRFGNLRF